MASDRMPFQAHAVRRERPPQHINQSITSDEELHYQSINHVRRKSCTTNQSITSDVRAALPINQELHYGCNAVHACMRTCGRACVHAQMWMCMCACARVDVHVCTATSPHVHVHEHGHVHVHVSMCTCPRSYAYARALLLYLCTCKCIRRCMSTAHGHAPHAWMCTRAPHYAIATARGYSRLLPQARSAQRTRRGRWLASRRLIARGRPPATSS